MASRLATVTRSVTDRSTTITPFIMLSKSCRYCCSLSRNASSARLRSVMSRKKTTRLGRPAIDKPAAHDIGVQDIAIFSQQPGVDVTLKLAFNPCLDIFQGDRNFVGWVNVHNRHARVIQPPSTRESGR